MREFASPYVFVGNNPVTGYDPDGRKQVGALEPYQIWDYINALNKELAYQRWQDHLDFRDRVGGGGGFGFTIITTPDGTRIQNNLTGEYVTPNKLQANGLDGYWTMQNVYIGQTEVGAWVKGKVENGVYWADHDGEGFYLPMFVDTYQNTYIWNSNDRPSFSPYGWQGTVDFINADPDYKRRRNAGKWLAGGLTIVTSGGTALVAGGSGALTLGAGYIAEQTTATGQYIYNTYVQNALVINDVALSFTQGLGGKHVSYRPATPGGIIAQQVGIAVRFGIQFYKSW